MTYDQLYDHILHYITQPLDDKRKACLILGAIMEFNLDCLDEGVDPRTIDMTGFVNEKLDQIDNEPNMNEKIAQAMQQAAAEYDT